MLKLETIPERASSTPSLTEFNPLLVPFQFDVISLIRNGWDYNKGVLEILLSGSVGSAKSLLLAHLAVTHCLFNKKANFLLGRKALDDLKGTLIQKVLEHVEGVLVPGEDYSYNRSSGDFEFYNGSRMTSMSWHDKNFLRFRSHEFSAGAIEELTENKGDYWGFYKEMRARIGRLPHIKECFIISATNPDSPSSEPYKYFFVNPPFNRRVFFSKTKDNRFLPKWYIDQLYDTFDEKEARRMLEGEWLELSSEVIYYSYGTHNEIDIYQPDPSFPVIMTFDFNIGIGKPLSIAFIQYINQIFYVFGEVVVEGANTYQALEEGKERGLISQGYTYTIHGDANGRARSTKSNRTDYQIIGEFLKEHGIDHAIEVRLSNPPVRERHIKVNGIMKSSKGTVRFYVTKNCKTVREGFRLTALKKGAGYLEDDSKHFQHITTAIGYAVISQLNADKMGNKFNQISF